ncbi:hypothetical protein [Rhizobium sp. 1399]|uniref:hypothetical protein n=1 Tax=Rhizobium sp. 1399 TaxID=2817758 RepID=UPI00285DB202|nr:hypothetical protein [Rhizobium sp. 1399]MDR6664275.1 hypothetical protein [Rhizobium sp. 1399]
MSDDRELKDQRIPIMMTGSEVTAIDDWSFKNRIRSRGEAIRRLCQIGLVFDDHRKEYVEKFRDIMDSVVEMNDLTKKAGEVDPGSVTEFEKSLMLASLNILQVVSRMVPLVRTTTGLANNFKVDKDVEEIIRETKEILSVGLSKKK